MSDGATTKPKKQFKSQSVNDLFRQQSTAHNSTAQSANVGPKDAFLRRSRSPGATKLKLVTKKIRTINTINNSKLTIRKTTSASPSPSPNESSASSSKNTPEPQLESQSQPQFPSESQSQLPARQEPDAKSTTQLPTQIKPQIQISTKDIEIDPIEKLPETLSINTEKFPISSQSSSSSNIAPNKSRFNWNDSSRSNSSTLWNDLQNKIDDVVPEQRSQSLNNAFSPDSSMTWSSPSSKISSFRKSASTPFQPLNQSPLTRPVESNSRFFQEINKTPFSLQSSQHSEVLNRSNDNSNETFWQSPNIWSNSASNHMEERQRSTKSDSAIGWSPFDSDPFASDEPFRQHSQSSQHQPSMESLNRCTSRFFPSPTVPQSQGFDLFENHAINDPNGVFRSTFDEQVTLTTPQRSNLPLQSSQPIIPQSFASPISQQQQQPITPQHFNQPIPFYHQMQSIRLESNPARSAPRELITTSSKMEKQVFPEHFKIQPDSIPVSLPKSSESNSRPSKESYYNELPHYPEGFSSTFYKRGVNNFMFIRELQPKIMTSKYGDSVEVRLTFPSTNDEFKMKSDIVDIDIRDLEGRLGGLKVNKPPGNFSRKTFSGRGSHRSSHRRG